MAERNPLNVRRFLEQSTAKSSVDELQKKGVRKVRVLDQRTLEKLIQDSVTKVLSGRSGMLTDEEKQKIYQDSRKELDRLMKEQNQMKQQAEAAAQDRDTLLKELENLQRQLQVSRNMYEERIRQAEQKAAAGDPGKQQELETKLGYAQEQNQFLQGKVQELEQKLKEASGGDPKEMQEAFMRGVQSQEGYINELKERLSNLEKEAAEARTKQAEEGALASKLEELSKRDDAVADRLAKLFNQTVESLNKKIGSIRSGAGTPAEDFEYHASGQVLENLLKEEIESNLGNISSEQKVKSKGMGDRLSKLKNLQAKFQKPKEEEGEKGEGEKK